MNQDEMKQAPVVIESADDDMRELSLDEVEEITGGFAASHRMHN